MCPPLPIYSDVSTSGLIWPRPDTWDGALRLFPLVDPATERPWAQLPVAQPSDISAAVAVARRFADQEWADPSPEKRLKILDRLITLVAERQEEFARRISCEMGAPIDFARDKQVRAALDHLQAIRAAASVEQDQTPDPDNPDHRVRYEPLGVAALITPWNWPLNQVVLKVGGALMAGCAMVLKPSEYSSTSTLLFAECMALAGADDGRFQLVLGDGDVGQALCTHPDVDVISFTGSTRVGAIIAGVAAPQFKRLNLELGGKSANILMADCNLPLAVEQGVAHAFRNTGQSCNAAARMLVEREIYDRVCTLAAGYADQTSVDLPTLDGPHLGAIVNEQQYKRVQGLIQQAIDQGARVIAGGVGRSDDLSEGYFAKPTVLADVTDEMDIFHTEVFGPVLTITPFDHEAQAIALANDTSYGLAGYVQTADPVKADRIACALQVGLVQVNGASRAPGAPFGGRRASGQGREAGLWSIRAFQDVKSVSGAAAMQTMRKGRR
jgi:aldehyde dehydrogenase (NAD+)